MKPLLKKLKENLDRREISARWTPSELLHVTVLFFGEVEDPRRDELAAALDEGLRDQPRFDLKISGLGAFSSPDEARVLWLGVQNSKRLRGMREEILQPLLKIGWSGEDAYEPHLTIGRLRNPHGLRDLVQQFRNVDLGKLAVRELVLFESIQRPPFPVYRPIARWELVEPVE